MVDAGKDWRDRLPKRKDPKEVKGIMVRPNAQICSWLSKQAKEHGTSVNMVVLAIIEDVASIEMERK